MSFDGLAGELNLLRLGEQILKLPAVATALGHQSLEETRVYTHPKTLEARYVDDVVYCLGGKGDMTLAQFNEKWWGGHPHGSFELIGALAAAHEGCA